MADANAGIWAKNGLETGATLRNLLISIKPQSRRVLQYACFLRISSPTRSGAHVTGLVPTFRSSWSVSATTFHELRKAMGT